MEFYLFSIIFQNSYASIVLIPCVYSHSTIPALIGFDWNSMDRKNLLHFGDKQIGVFYFNFGLFFLGETTTIIQMITIRGNTTPQGFFLSRKLAKKNRIPSSFIKRIKGRMNAREIQNLYLFYENTFIYFFKTNLLRFPLRRPLSFMERVKG